MTFCDWMQWGVIIVIWLLLGRTAQRLDHLTYNIAAIIHATGILPILEKLETKETEEWHIEKQLKQKKTSWNDTSPESSETEHQHGKQ